MQIRARLKGLVSLVAVKYFCVKGATPYIRNACMCEPGSATGPISVLLELQQSDIWVRT